MKTLLDNNLWASDLYEGNGAFVQVGGSISPPIAGDIYVVSQVRPATNDFIVLKSNPVPPDPGPGWSFTQVASYTFPNANTSFDPVITYEGTLIHIIGTQDNFVFTGNNSTDHPLPVDILKFTFDTSNNNLTGPTVLATASLVRDGYDICALTSGYTFVAASVTEPITVDQVNTRAFVTAISISGNVLTVETSYGSPPQGNLFPPGIPVTFSGLQLATFLNGVTVTVTASDFFHFTAVYNHPDYSQSFSPPMYESGFATWLPGHNILGFMLDASDTIVAPPWALASAPFRTGPVFGSASVCFNGTEVEVYYESHPKNTTFKDQTFSIIQLLGTPTLSPPAMAWGSPTTLNTFTGRYTDNRLTVIPAGSSRLACLVFFDQPPQVNSLVGNILLGYTGDVAGSPPSWNWQVAAGPILGGSVLQAAISQSQTAGASVSYILAPIYNKRGGWAYDNLATYPPWQPSYNGNDWVLFEGEDFLCINSMTNRGWWDPNSNFNLNDIVAVRVHYQATHSVTGNIENPPPTQDTANWGTSISGSGQPWNPQVPYPAGSVVFVPAYYQYIGTGGATYLSPLLDTVNWRPLESPADDFINWVVVPAAWYFYSGGLDLTTLSITNFATYAALGLTWLRGTKSILDDKTLWAVVGEASTGETGSPPQEDVPYYVSHFNVPPSVQLSPLSGSVFRGTPFLLDASATYDPDTGDTIAYTWSLALPSPGDSPYVHLTPLSPTDQADLLVDRAIGGALVPLSVSVVAVDSTGSNVNHPPMTVSSVSYDDGTNTASLVVNSVATVSDGQEILAYGLGIATFLNNSIITVTNILLSPPTIVGTVTFALDDLMPGSPYGPSADAGFAIVPPQYAVAQSQASPPAGLIVPYNPPPNIIMPSIPTALRNSLIVVAPIITGATDPDDLTTYTWIQISGTTMTALGLDTPVLMFYTNGAIITGETITWQLTVNDGVNAPVSAQISIAVDDYFSTSPPTPVDSKHLSRALWGGNIADRNVYNVSPPSWVWGPLDVSGLLTDLSWAKRTSILQEFSTPMYGNDRYVVISPYSTLILLDSVTPTILRRLFLPALPNAFPPLVSDAVHTEDDYTLVLGDDNKLYRYDTAPLIDTDNPDITLNLSNYSNLIFTKVFSTVSFSGKRVLALSGPDGCLLAQIDNETLVPVALLEINTTSQLLYGANNVQFVRLSEVENTRSGEIFLGTIDAQGKTYETLVDLTHEAIIGTWNKTQLINQYVVSGEILFRPYSEYAGKPLAPIFNAPLDKGAAPQPGYELVNLSWNQNRPDLCNGYVVFQSVDSGSTWVITSTVGSGAIESITVTLAQGQTYLFKLFATSGDGDSGYSNVVSLAL